MRKVLNTLKNTLSTLEKETPAENSSFADSLHQDAWDAVSRGDLEAVEEILRELKSLKVPERYLALLQEASEIKEENKQPLPTGEEAGDGDKPEEEEEAVAEEPAEKTETTAENKAISKTPSKKPTKSSPSASVPSADKDSGTSKIQVIFVVVLIVVIAGALGAAFLGRKKK